MDFWYSIFTKNNGTFFVKEEHYESKKSNCNGNDCCHVSRYAGRLRRSKKDDKKEDGGKKKLTISTWDNDTSPQFKTAVDVFKEKHPDVEIEFVDTAANEYNNKLTVMLAGGDPDPDVIFVKDMGTQISMQEKGRLNVWTNT